MTNSIRECLLEEKYEEIEIELKNYGYGFFMNDTVLRINIESLVNDCKYGTKGITPTQALTHPTDNDSTHVIDLPTEVIWMICEYLSPCQLLFLSLTCKEFNEIINDSEIWRQQCHKLENFWIWKSIIFYRVTMYTNNIIYGPLDDFPTKEIQKKLLLKSKNENENKNINKEKNFLLSLSSSSTSLTELTYIKPNFNNNELLEYLTNNDDNTKNNISNNTNNNNNNNNSIIMYNSGFNNNNNNQKKLKPLSTSEIRHQYIEYFDDPKQELLKKVKYIFESSKHIRKKTEQQQRFFHENSIINDFYISVYKYVKFPVLLLPASIIVFTILLTLNISDILHIHNNFWVISPIAFNLCLFYLIFLIHNLIKFSKRTIPSFIFTHVVVIIILLPLVFIILKISNIFVFSWIKTFIPLLIFEIIILIIYFFSFCSIREEYLSRHDVVVLCLIGCCIVPLLIFIFLLGYKLDGEIMLSWSKVFTPLYIFELYPFIFIILQCIPRTRYPDGETIIIMSCIPLVILAPLMVFQLLLILYLDNKITNFIYAMIPIYIYDFAFLLIFCVGLYPYFISCIRRGRNRYELI
ncbi:fam11a [Anaeramoeba flamelloides]|uniref:Fam11a n=1 Tax=Anaeramoeba flamelloides TaxID=1746091 RepID=A0ABQ8Z483_9EUKA|nr:fam11a [Anaeramoeba flamelloides]